LAKRFRRALVRKMNQIKEQAVARRKEDAKIFENKKMLKARVMKMLHALVERPKCPNHIKQQRDYQLKIDYINAKWEREHGVGEHAHDKVNKN
jgi:hypothetical protein